MRLKCIVPLLLAACGVANATTEFALPVSADLSGNFNGLTYRASDGHFLMTNESGAVLELDSAGQQLASIQLSSLDPSLGIAAGVHYLAADGGLVASGYSYQVDGFGGDLFLRHFIRLPGDLSSASTDAYTSTLDTLTGNEELGDLSGSAYLTFDNATGTVASRSWTGAPQFNVDLAHRLLVPGDAGGGCWVNDGPAPSCLKDVAYSWNGGFFAIDEGNSLNGYVGRLMEFDADGSLRHAIALDAATFDYHPWNLATDLEAHRIFVEFNNNKVVTFSETDFVSAPNTVALIPEPGTAPMLLLGLGAAGLALRRHRRSLHSIQ